MDSPVSFQQLINVYVKYNTSILKETYIQDLLGYKIVTYKTRLLGLMQIVFVLASLRCWKCLSLNALMSLLWVYHQWRYIYSEAVSPALHK